MEGINWRKRSITVRWELFPEESMECDIDGMDLDELNHLVPRNIKQLPQRLGFDVEIAWRTGVAYVFPPDVIRIIGIIPESELLRPYNYRPLNGLSRPSIIEIQMTLTKKQLKFLKWFAWADTNWDTPNLNGIVKYLMLNDNILGHSTSRNEILQIIQFLVKHGILIKTRTLQREELTHSYCD